MHNIFKVLGDENRYKVFSYLVKEGESCVCDLQALLDIKQANLSKHLGVMKKADMLSAKQVGKFIHYSLKEEFVKEYQLLVSLVDLKEERFEIDETLLCNYKGSCE